MLGRSPSPYEIKVCPASFTHINFWTRVTRMITFISLNKRDSIFFLIESLFHSWVFRYPMLASFLDRSTEPS